MFAVMKYRWQLCRPYRAMAKNRKIYSKKIEEAKKIDKGSEKIRQLQFLEHDEDSMYREDIDHLTTTFLTRKARRLMLPIPDLSDDQLWESYQWGGGYRKLTEKGISELRSTIRTEGKERRDAYLPMITALTGLVGVITGLLAVILN